ncbi:MAG TPA: GNAT family N-acetyltransferase [Actinomycetota bacterium]|nr:GNAT family N-acetyltransferase [Actinomycetota bacterium]
MVEATLEIHPLTPDRWDDLVTLFDRPGDPKGCWCMFYRVRSRDFERLWGKGARSAFRGVVADGPPPGLLAYRDGVPVGWCAVAPRDAYPRILNSRVLRPADDAPACWAAVCFYVLRSERRDGVAAALLEAAVAFAAEHGAEAVEGYPKDTEGAKRHANEMFVGSMSMFAEAGFSEAARRSPARPIMRRGLGGRGGPAGSR